MLYWAFIFFIFALVAGLLGFGGLASASAGIAQILFFIFIILFVISVGVRALRGKPPVADRGQVAAGGACILGIAMRKA